MSLVVVKKVVNERSESVGRIFEISIVHSADRNSPLRLDRLAFRSSGSVHHRSHVPH